MSWKWIVDPFQAQVQALKFILLELLRIVSCDIG